MRRQGRNPDYLDFLDLPAALAYGVLSGSSDWDRSTWWWWPCPAGPTVDVARVHSAAHAPRVGLLSLTKGVDPASRSRLSRSR